MARSTLISLSVLASSAIHIANAQSSASFTPLAAKRFDYPDGIPYQVDTDNGPRGRQVGYNLCNSTTEGPESLCQTSFVNSAEDFCLWAPPEPDSIVGNTEGEMVAWCTKPGRGTRLIPEGALKGVQFTRTPRYVQVVGFVDQTQINIQAGDYGGEMDPHGADRRGNPLGGLLYSNAFGGGNGTNSTQWTQVMQWHNFMGSDLFCIKACDPSDDNDWQMCEHIFDRIGCYYNAPADYSNINGTFTSCDGDSQLPPGIYIGENGQRTTFTQPPESLGVISSMPYQPAIPSSSQCTTFSSAELFSELTGAAAAETSAPTSAALTSAAVSAATGLLSSAATRAPGAANNARPTTTTPNSGAHSSALVSGLATFLGAGALAAMLAL